VQEMVASLGKALVQLRKLDGEEDVEGEE